jgi:hypothetical protein
MAEELSYVDRLVAEVEKELGMADDEAEAGSWDYAVATAMSVVGPILAGWEQRLGDVREECRKSLESWNRSRERLTEERKLLLWLHAEAAWWLQLSRDEHEVDEILHNWTKRVAYLEARVGELHQTIGDLRAANADLDDRRARWAGEHEKRRDELKRSEASRQAWAEEAMRLEFRLEQVREDRQRRIEKGNRLRNALVDAFGFDQDPDEYPGDEEFIRLLAARPQCAVHPDGIGVDLAVEGGDPTP